MNNFRLNHPAPDHTAAQEKICAASGRPYRAILFDLDGTLLDTAEGILSSVCHTTEAMGYAPLTEDVIRTFIGPPIFHSLKRIYHLDDAEAARATEVYREYYKTHDLFKARPYDGILTLLGRLRDQGFLIGVATLKREDYALTILEHFGITPCCDAICGSDYASKMTKADVVRRCLKKLGCSAEEAVLIGDTSSDGNGAREAGVDLIAVTYGFGPTDEAGWTPFSPVFVAESADAIGSFLLSRPQEEIRLLDCTLRDGGYVNDWEFGHANIVNIFERLISAGVDILEIGFLDQRRPFDPNRSIMPDTESADRIYGRLDKGRTMLVAMIDYGTCGIENLAPCKNTCIDGIRVIFKKHIRREAIAFCRQVKELGYQVFAQAVSITSYSDEEMLDLIGLVNDLTPYALSIVDTYGLLHQDNLIHYFDLLNQNLKPEIAIGYHSHNNFQLAYSNSIEVLRKPANRTVLIDASLYGMGKSAGNLPIELISMYLNSNYGRSFDISQMLEAIDINIMPFYRKSPWGYNLFYYISASNNCHPSYVRYLMDKQTLSLKSLNAILSRIEPEKKLLYDKGYIEKLYLEHQSTECTDEADLARLAAQWQGKRLLLLGPGKQVELQKERIEAHIREQHPTVISINYIPEDIPIDYAFLTNSRRYVQLNSRLLELAEQSPRPIRIIATSNVATVRDSFDYTLDYASLIDTEAEIIDNSFIMLLHVLVRAGVREAACAGFDGYHRGENYLKSEMDYQLAREKAQTINQYVREKLAELKGTLTLHFVTDSLYQ